jgi:DNA-binding phage protein
MPTTTSPVSDIAALRSAHIKTSKTETQLDSKLQQLGKRLPEIASELAVAMADGNSALIEQLRAERASTEADIRDIEPALNIAHQRVRLATKALALAEIETSQAAFAAKARTFVAKAEEMRQLANELRAAQREHHARFSRCDFSEPLSHPMHWMAVYSLLGSMPKSIFHALDGVTGTLVPNE